MRNALLALLPCLCATLAADPTPAFGVLKITKDIRVLPSTPVVTFEPVPSEELGKRKSALLKEALDAHKKWEADQEAFKNDKANKKKEFVALEPEAVSVSFAREKLPEKDAEAYAKDSTEKARRWYVVRLMDWDKKTQILALEPQEIREKWSALLEAYQSKKDAWQKDVEKAVPSGGGGPPAPAGGPTTRSVPAPARPTILKFEDKAYTARKDAEKTAEEASKTVK